jgi:hypothetical protein
LERWQRELDGGGKRVNRDKGKEVANITAALPLPVLEKSPSER